MVERRLRKALGRINEELWVRRGGRRGLISVVSAVALTLLLRLHYVWLV